MPKPFLTLGVIFLVLVVKASAVILFREDFESLTLGPYTSPTETGGDGTDWTNVAPTGWVRDQGATPVGNPVEFYGWTFHDRQSWINTEGDQQRSFWQEGIGTVMVADPDAYDDGTNVDERLYNVNIRTPMISLSGVQANSVHITFSSSFRAEEPEVATLDVSFDGANFINLLTYDASDTINFPDGALFNDPVNIDVSNPAGAGTMQFRFGMNTASNDWWWAVDNIEVTGVVPEPSTAATTMLTIIPLVGLSRRRRPLRR